MKKSFLILLFLTSLPSFAIVCGIAQGFPPYQFSIGGEFAGADVDLITNFNKRGSLEIVIDQGEWLSQVSRLYHTDELDCIFGMEESVERKKKFDFSNLLYNRYSALFVLEKNSMSDLQDLEGKVILGDKDSAMESELKKLDLLHKIRIKYPNSKNEAMVMLANSKVEAAIMPLAVGRYLAVKLGVKIRIFKISSSKVPVGIAVKKNRADLLKKINSQLEFATKGEPFSKIIRKWGLKY